MGGPNKPEKTPRTYTAVSKPYITALRREKQKYDRIIMRNKKSDPENVFLANLQYLTSFQPVLKEDVLNKIVDRKVVHRRSSLRRYQLADMVEEDFNFEASRPKYPINLDEGSTESDPEDLQAGDGPVSASAPPTQFYDDGVSGVHKSLVNDSSESGDMGASDSESVSDSEHDEDEGMDGGGSEPSNEGDGSTEELFSEEDLPGVGATSRGGASRP